MQTILNQLTDKIFTLEKRQYKVLEVFVKLEKAVIKTDKRSFVLYPHELQEWIGKIVIMNPDTLISNKEQWLPSKDIVSKMTVLKAEIIHTNAQSRRITDKLEAVFNQLSDKPGEEHFKQAKAMVDASNAIVNMQLANYKFLTLK